MILSRFWYAVLALALGAAAFILLIAVQQYNRAGNRAMGESLTADSSAVEWYLKDDARRRAGALVGIAVNADLRTSLAKSSGENKVSRELQTKATAALKKAAAEIPADLKFD